MGIKKTKVSELPAAASLEGLVVLGVDSTNKSVKVGMELLKGNSGADAFTVWQSQPGNEGKTFEDYMTAIKGDKGNDGNDGKSFNIIGLYPTLDDLETSVPDGSDVDGVYGVGIEAPYTYYAWVDVDGIGKWASQGQLQGGDGKSAYEIAVQNGFSGTEAEWLASLKGKDAPELKPATASTLGGIKVGNNLTMRADGTLDAALGSGTGDGVLTLPYVAPECDSDGNITNSAAFVDAWGGILAEYLAAPDSHALYMEIDAGEGLMLRMPCNLMNMGGETDAVQWLISGFGVVNVPMSSSDPVPCKAIGMANVVCNAAGEMQSLVMYASEGIVGADGQPNLLGADDAVIIDLGLDTGALDEDKLKATLQPVLAKLTTPTPPRVIVKCNAFYINGMFQSIGNQFVITAYGAHPYAVGDINNTYIIRAGVVGTIANGTITTVQGGYVGQELATTEAMTAALSEKAPLLPESLAEQLVPGEFWDGKQVYVRTFTGMTPVEDDGHSFLQMTLEPAATACQFIRGTVDQVPPCYFGGSAGINFNNNLYWTYDSVVGIGLRILGPRASIINPSGGTNNYMGGKSYRLTFKYTKA